MQKIHGFKSDQVHPCRLRKNDKGADQHLRRFSVNDGGADSPLASSSFTERRQGSEGVNIYRVDPSRG